MCAHRSMPFPHGVCSVYTAVHRSNRLVDCRRLCASPLLLLASPSSVGAFGAICADRAGCIVSQGGGRSKGQRKQKQTPPSPRTARPRCPKQIDRVRIVPSTESGSMTAHAHRDFSPSFCDRSVMEWPQDKEASTTQTDAEARPPDTAGEKEADGQARSVFAH